MTTLIICVETNTGFHRPFKIHSSFVTSHVRQHIRDCIKNKEEVWFPFRGDPLLTSKKWQAKVHRDVIDFCLNVERIDLDKNYKLDGGYLKGKFDGTIIFPTDVEY